MSGGHEGRYQCVGLAHPRSARSQVRRPTSHASQPAQRRWCPIPGCSSRSDAMGSEPACRRRRRPLVWQASWALSRHRGGRLRQGGGPPRVPPTVDVGSRAVLLGRRPESSSAEISIA